MFWKKKYTLLGMFILLSLVSFCFAIAFSVKADRGGFDGMAGGDFTNDYAKSRYLRRSVFYEVKQEEASWDKPPSSKVKLIIYGMSRQFNRVDVVTTEGSGLLVFVDGKQVKKPQEGAIVILLGEKKGELKIFSVSDAELRPYMFDESHVMLPGADVVRGLFGEKWLSYVRGSHFNPDYSPQQ